MFYLLAGIEIFVTGLINLVHDKEEKPKNCDSRATQEQERARERDAEREEKRKRKAEKDRERDARDKRDERERKDIRERRDKLESELERRRVAQLQQEQEWKQKMRHREETDSKRWAQFERERNQERKDQRERERDVQGEWEQEREAQREREAQQKQDERERKEIIERRDQLEAELERVRLAQLQCNQEWEQKMKDRDEMDNKRWVKLEKEMKRDKKLQKEREAKAQQERERDKQEHLEEIERERRERIRGERKRDKEFDYLKRMVQEGIKLFYELLRRQQQSRGRDGTFLNQGGSFMTIESPDETQIFDEFFLALDLPCGNGDFVKDVVNVFNGSLLTLEDNPDKSLDMAESSQRRNYGNELALIELPEQFSVGFEDDILNSVMTTMNIGIPTNEPPVNFYGDFKRSMIITPIDVGSQAKEQGNAYFEDENFNEAIKCYSKSINKTPTAEVYSNRAMAYIKLNKFIEAEKDCTSALKIDACYFEAYVRRATARSQLGSYLKGALNDAEVALEMNPNCLDMRQLRAELREMLS